MTLNHSIAGSPVPDDAKHVRDHIMEIAAAVPGFIYSYRLGPDGASSMPFASPGIDSIFGVSPEEVVKDFAGMGALIHPDDAARTLASITESAHNMAPWHQEFRVLHPKRGERWIEANSTPTLQPDGAILWHGYMQDVTNRRRGQEALYYQNELLAAQQEASADGILVVNSDFSIHSMNSRFVEMWRVPPEIVESKDHKALLEYVTPQFARPKSFATELEKRYSDPAGKSHDELPLTDGRIIERRSAPLMGQDQTIRGRLWTFRDVTEARNAEQALRESERFARSTLDSLTSQIAILDADGKIIAINSAWSIFARENHAALHTVMEGANYLSACDSAFGAETVDAQSFAAGIREVLAGTRDEYALEYPCHSPTEKRWFVGRVSRFVGEGPLRLVVAHQSVTERVLALNEVRKTQELLSEMGRSAKIGGWDFDLVTGKGSWTDETIEMYGLSPGDPLDPQRAISYYTGAGQAQLADAFRAACEDGKPYDLELEIKGEDGIRKWVRAVGNPEFTDGRVTRLFGSLQDITLRKKADIARQASETLFSTLFHDSPSAVVIYSEGDGKITIANEGFSDLTGYTVEEMIGRNSHDLKMFVDPSERDAIRAEVAANGLVLFKEAKIQSKSGEIKDALGSIRSITVNGKKMGIAVWTDFTERKHAEEEVRKTKELLSEMGRVAMIGGWELDPATGVGTWTEEAARIHALPGEKVMDMRWALDFYVGESRDRKAAACKAAMEDGKPFDLELEFQAADGVRKWVRTIGNPELKNGRVTRVYGSVQDITERKKNELALHDSEALFSTIFHDNPSAVAMFSVDERRITMANQSFLDLTGYTREEIIDRNSQELELFLDPTERDTIRAEFSSTDLIPGRETRMRSKSGQIKNVLGSIRRVTLNGKRIGIAVWTDYTEQKKAQEELRKSRESFKSIFENASLGIYRMSPDGTILLANQALCRMLGFRDESQLVGKNLENNGFGPACDRTLFRQKIANEGQVIGFESDWIRIDGSRIQVSQSARFVRNQEEESFYEGTVEDITARATAAEALAASEGKFSSYIKHAPFALIVADPTGKIVDFNQRTIDQFGYEPETLRTMSVMQLHKPEDMKEVGENLQQLGTVGHTEAEFDILCADGRAIPVSLWATLLDNQYSIAFLEDISQRKRAEAEMRALQDQFLHAQKMEAVGRLAGGVAHDFNNLLQVINSYSEKIVLDYSHDAALARYGKSIHHAGEIAANLTRQLLAFSRKAPSEARKLELDEVLTSMEDMIRRLVGEDITVRLDLNCHGLFIEVDPSQIEQIVMNLAVNSRDAMPEGGLLTVSTSCGRHDSAVAGEMKTYGVDSLQLTVSDSGHGMDFDTRQRVFEPFFTTKEFGRGTGLGLSTVFGIVQQCGGSIGIDSELGVGTQVHVFFPIVEQSALPVVPAALTQSQVGSERILVAEDDEDLRELYQDVLKELGYEVVTAENGRAALDLIEASDAGFNLVISDTIMPLMGGVELFEVLQRTRPELKLLLVSGYAGSRVDPLKALHGVELLTKPFPMKTFGAKVRQLLDVPPLTH